MGVHNVLIPQAHHLLVSQILSEECCNLWVYPRKRWLLGYVRKEICAFHDPYVALSVMMVEICFSFHSLLTHLIYVHDVCQFPQSLHKGMTLSMLHEHKPSHKSGKTFDGVHGMYRS